MLSVEIIRPPKAPALGECTCSGRTPSPIKRAGMPCSQGTAVIRRTTSGAFSGSPPGFSATLMMLFCTTTCIRCVILTGNSRRRRTASSSSSDGQPPQLCCQQVRGRDRVLHGEIDADAANRRHRMRGIADAQQAGPRPALQPIDRDREQLDVVPALHVDKPDFRIGAMRATSSSSACSPLAFTASYWPLAMT